MGQGGFPIFVQLSRREGGGDVFCWAVERVWRAANNVMLNASDDEHRAVGKYGRGVPTARRVESPRYREAIILGRKQGGRRDRYS